MPVPPPVSQCNASMFRTRVEDGEAGGAQKGAVLVGRKMSPAVMPEAMETG